MLYARINKESMKYIVEKELEATTVSLAQAEKTGLTESKLFFNAKKLVLEDLLDQYDLYFKESEKVQERVHKEMSAIEKRKLDLYLKGKITEDELKGE